LSKIAGIVLATPGQWRFSIEGHTDSVGSDVYNQTLSEKRAQTVADYLMAAGVSRSSVLSVQGLGETRPLASNDTEDGRQRNRRVEIIIEDGQRPTSEQFGDSEQFPRGQ
jgi:outer membrane protein OmpA-like peptidoglycan-associated protein